MCMPYFVFLLSSSTQNVFVPLLASVFIIIGIAGIGYLTNDLGDRQKDKLIEKENATANLDIISIVFLIVLFLLLALIPWFFLPMSRNSIFLLLLQFILFCAYAFPPLRLKERGIWGVLADAGYAHVNPALLAAYTFYLYTNKTVDGFCLFMGLVGSWQLISGIRNILFHQVKDHDKDLLSGTKTYVTNVGIKRTEMFLKNFLLPLETILFVGFALFISRSFFFFLPFSIVYWALTAYRLRRNKTIVTYREYTYFYLDALYLNWLPMIVLAGLIMRSVNFLPVFIMHFLIFRTDVKSYIRSHIIHLRS
jgi:4-hydroxybenzoate polyprenyltransferase